MSISKIDFRRLRQAKEDKRYSSYRISAIDGVIQAPTVQKIVRGIVSPTAVNLKRICDVLEIPIQEIFIDDKRAA